jgi:hypothetical protein
VVVKGPELIVHLRVAVVGEAVQAGLHLPDQLVGTPREDQVRGVVGEEVVAERPQVGAGDSA